MSKLQLDKFKFESEKKRKIKQLELDKATIAFDKVKTKYRTSIIASEKNIQIQRIRVQQLVNEVATIHENLAYFIILCPSNGILQLARNRATNQLMKVTDKVWPGAQIACVPDLSKMKVLSSINEIDIGKVSIGQSVTVRLDAYPDASFEGNITLLSKICYKKDKEDKFKVFDFEVLLKKTDPLLKPGMTVSCEIFFAKLKNVLYVSNNCIYNNDSAYFVVLEKNQEKYKIKLGPSNNRNTVVYGELKAGDQLTPVEMLQTQIKK